MLGEQALAPVRSTPGVSTLVRFGMEYARVPPSLLAELRAREQDGLHGLRLPGEMVAGDSIRVEAALFTGLTGVFVKARGGDRVEVRLEILGHQSHISLPKEHVFTAKMPDVAGRR